MNTYFAERDALGHVSELQRDAEIYRQTKAALEEMRQESAPRENRFAKIMSNVQALFAPKQDARPTQTIPAESN